MSNGGSFVAVRFDLEVISFARVFGQSSLTKGLVGLKEILGFCLCFNIFVPTSPFALYFTYW